MSVCFACIFHRPQQRCGAVKTAFLAFLDARDGDFWRGNGDGTIASIYTGAFGYNRPCAHQICR